MAKKNRARSVTPTSEKRPASTELTGGEGFSYDDTVVAYYLSSLLRRERAAAQAGFVVSVAVQRQGHGNPMDDLVVEFDDVGTKRVLGLQIKKSATISGAASNNDFREIIAAAVKTQASEAFTASADLCGFVVEHVTAATLRSLTRLIDWAKGSATGADFGAFFSPTGSAAAAERNLRSGLLTVIGAQQSEARKHLLNRFALPRNQSGLLNVFA
jgi:hypothetical protein